MNFPWHKISSIVIYRYLLDSYHYRFGDDALGSFNRWEELVCALLMFWAFHILSMLFHYHLMLVPVARTAPYYLCCIALLYRPIIIAVVIWFRFSFKECESSSLCASNKTLLKHATCAFINPLFNASVFTIVCVFKGNYRWIGLMALANELLIWSACPLLTLVGLAISLEGSEMNMSFL